MRQIRHNFSWFLQKLQKIIQLQQIYMVDFEKKTYQYSISAYYFQFVYQLSFLCQRNNQFQKQMGCTGLGNSKTLKRDKNQAHLTPQEVHLIEMIFDDLAQRNNKKKITRQVFLLYFHKKSYWGDYMFRQFSQNKQWINKSEFIQGMEQIYQISQQQKISTLFQFFSATNAKGDGINFQTLLSILYNYPKQELLKVMDDPLFLGKCLQMKPRVRKSKEQPVQQIKRIPSKQRSDTYESKDKKKYNHDYQISSNDSDRSVMRIPTGYGFGTIMKNIRQRHEVVEVKGKICGEDICVRTNNYNCLVRKFAKNIFKDYNHDIKDGKLRYSQFASWMSAHKNLYNNFYQGFHQEIWKYSTTKLEGQQEPAKCPQYLITSHQIQSDAMYKDKKVYLILANNTLVVTQHSNQKVAEAIINMEGLSANKIFSQKKGYGFQVFHRDQYYHKKKFYLKNQEIQRKWMQKLKVFRGVDIRQLYQFGSKIGAGNFSIVYTGTQLKTGKKYAIKQIDNKKIESYQMQILMRQSEIMKNLDNDMLIKHKDTIQTKNQTYIITELVEDGLELNQLLTQKGRPLTQIEASIIARQLLLGVNHIHLKGYVHRDLKPENVLTKPDFKQSFYYHIKIIDFGLSVGIHALNNKSYGGQAGVIGGTPGYMPPEMLEYNQISYKTDSFAIGGIIYFMLTKKVPFSGQKHENIRVIYNRTIDNALDFSQDLWGGISQHAKDLVQALMHKDPQKRMNIKDCLLHKWFSQTQSAIKAKRK